MTLNNFGIRANNCQNFFNEINDFYDNIVFQSFKI